jgi:large subunit ribosomal protein L15
MGMYLHNLATHPAARHRRKRVGRGESSGRGKTSGRGNKGQMSRTGHKRKPAFEGGQMQLIRRIPKRGFTAPGRIGYVPVNVGLLQRFSDGTDITAEMLRKEGLARGPGRGIKILGGGDLTRKLTVRAQAFSRSARAKIEAAGGVCEVAG